MNKLNFPVIVEQDEDGYFAFCPSLQGCYTQADSYEEIMENIKDAISLHLEDRLSTPLQFTTLTDKFISLMNENNVTLDELLEGLQQERQAIWQEQQHI